MFYCLKIESESHDLPHNESDQPPNFGPPGSGHQNNGITPYATPASHG